MGPLRLSDLIGLDTLKLIADKMFEEFKEAAIRGPAAAASHGRSRSTRQEIRPGLLQLLELTRLLPFPNVGLR